MEKSVHIIGAGLAGSEAAYSLAQRGVKVELFEMRPTKSDEAHQGALFAELVCSNSLKSNAPLSAPGILKSEMKVMGSLILESALKHSVPSGEALAVDRDRFAEEITQKIKEHPNIKIHTQEHTGPKENQITLIATGPLTSGKIAEYLQEKTKSPHSDGLYFYDAIAPIIDAQSIDNKLSFIQNRYDKGQDQAYINCPLSKQEYELFIEELSNAQKVEPRSFEKEKFFQGCQPIEAIAATGKETLRFGPMKPVGLTPPEGLPKPYAVVQLRPENRARTAYNMVGFQTKLKYGEQTRVFKLIPALKNAQFLRMGSIHRNMYVCAPDVLRPDLSIKTQPLVYLAGQITGVEGYLESAAIGLLCSHFIYLRTQGLPHSAPPANTAMGALLGHLLASPPKDYQPSNMHFGLFDPLYFPSTQNLKKDALKMAYATQAIVNFRAWWDHQK